MSKVPDNARTDLAVLYGGRWRLPSAKRGVRPLWVLRVFETRDTECYEVYWSDKTSMLVDAHEVCPMEDVERASKRPRAVSPGPLEAMAQAARSEGQPLQRRDSVDFADFNALVDANVGESDGLPPMVHERVAAEPRRRRKGPGRPPALSPAPAPDVLSTAPTTPRNAPPLPLLTPFSPVDVARVSEQISALSPGDDDHYVSVQRLREQLLQTPLPNLPAVLDHLEAENAIMVDGDAIYPI